MDIKDGQDQIPRQKNKRHWLRVKKSQRWYENWKLNLLKIQTNDLCTEMKIVVWTKCEQKFGDTDDASNIIQLIKEALIQGTAHIPLSIILGT